MDMVEAVPVKFARELYRRLPPRERRVYFQARAHSHCVMSNRVKFMHAAAAPCVTSNSIHASAPITTKPLNLPPRIINQTQLDPRHSFDTDVAINKARFQALLADKHGIPQDRLALKIPGYVGSGWKRFGQMTTTEPTGFPLLISLFVCRVCCRNRSWEGIQAARQLEQEGIACLVTYVSTAAGKERRRRAHARTHENFSPTMHSLFHTHIHLHSRAVTSIVQAAAAADAHASYIAPYVGRVTDWKGQEEADEEDGVERGVRLARDCQLLFRARGSGTKVRDGLVGCFHALNENDTKTTGGRTDGTWVKMACGSRCMSIDSLRAKLCRFASLR